MNGTSREHESEFLEGKLSYVNCCIDCGGDIKIHVQEVLVME
jgi:hypothetical protein